MSGVRGEKFSLFSWPSHWRLLYLSVFRQRLRVTLEYDVLVKLSPEQSRTFVPDKDKRSFPKNLKKSGHRQKYYASRVNIFYPRPRDVVVVWLN